MLELPFELLNLIIERLQPISSPGPGREAVKNLSLTCSKLQELAQHRLFHTVKVGDTKKLDDQRILEIRRLFHSRPESVQWIRNLSVSIYNAQNQRDRMSGTDIVTLANNLEKIFLKMTNLRKVRMRHTRITPAMQNHLWSLARRTLVEIQCQDVELDDLPPGNTTQSTSDLQLKIVGIDSTFWKPYAPFMAIILSPQLRELKVSSTALDSVFNACGVVNDRALPTARLSALLRLEAFLISDELILLFLRCCPNLESLSIHLPPSVPSSLSSTWSNSEEKYLVPALSKYYGPVELAFLLCPGRPIRTIRLPAITRGQAPPSRSDLAILQSGSVPLEALEFRVQNLTETMWTDLADFLPSLKHLTITFDIMPSLAELQLEVLVQRMPFLEKLALIN